MKMQIPCNQKLESIKEILGKRGIRSYWIRNVMNARYKGLYKFQCFIYLRYCHI